MIPKIVIGPTEFFIADRYDAHVMDWKWAGYMKQFMSCKTGLMDEVDKMIKGMK